MKTWVVANQKGGVGKTTTAVTLAAVLANRGERVLAIDFDPHGSLSSYFGFNPDTTDNGVYTLFQRAASGVRVPLAALLRRTPIERMWLLPASTAMVSLDRQLSTKDGMGLVLASMLADCGKKFDRVIIDCPPMLGVLLVNALAACDLVIVPVQTEFLALKGLERIMHTFAMVGKSRKKTIKSLIVPTMFDRRTRAAIDSLCHLMEFYMQDMWDEVIPVDTAFRDASRVGLPLTTLNPTSQGARAYERLCDHLLDREDPASATTNLAQAS
jgi:chromosome partitioning protein